jgi:copper(I)-binding protein
MRSLTVILLFAAAPAWAQVSIDKPWARATAPGAQVAGGYMVVHNKGSAPDRLVGASSPLAERVELHVTVRKGDIESMRQVKEVRIPANGSYELKPGGGHLMFVNIRRPFKEGEKVPATLKFQKAGEVAVELHVAGLGSQKAPDHSEHSKHSGH